MQMENEKVFRTKTGYCHVFPDKIVLSRSGVAGELAKGLVGGGIGRIVVIYSVLVLFAGYQSWIAFGQGRMMTSILFISLALALAYNIFRGRNNSAASVLDRSSIKRVLFKAALPGATRALFEVYFTDTSGKERKRLIMLPGSLTGGVAETEKALGIMREEGLLVD